MSMQDNIINNILLSINDLSNDIKDRIKDVLIIELHQYEIKKSCTELIVDDSDNIKLLKRFIATKKLENKSEKTLERYYQQNVKMLDFLHKPINDISCDDIKFYLSYIKQDRNLCNNTVSGIARCISSFFSFLTVNDIIVKNPCLALGKISIEKVIRKPFSDEELDLIKNNCVSKRDAALIELLSSTGCRVSEVSAINISDVNFSDSSILINGKGNKQRIVYLSNKSIALLEKYLIYREYEYEKHYSSTALFVSRNSDRLSKNGIENVVRKLGNKCGVEAYPHKFRRTFCTNLLSKNMGIQDVAKLMGHSQITTTEMYNSTDQELIKKRYMQYMN